VFGLVAVLIEAGGLIEHNFWGVKKICPFVVKAFHKIAQEDRKERLLLLLGTSSHVVYATIGFTLVRVYDKEPI
jgi:4-hydroxy-3-methylbut-2-enyl diphosphate reductase IspH